MTPKTREIITDEDRIDALRRATVPVPGRPGVRRDPSTGREWYSARWTGDARFDGVRS